jgi:activator of 2-hydroxyglutaryl-CoA dehydratase
MKGQEILGYATVPTGFEVVAAAQTALHHALDNVRISHNELAGIVTTGIFRDMVKELPLNVNKQCARNM